MATTPDETRQILEDFKAFWLRDDYADDNDGFDEAIRDYVTVHLRGRAIARAYEALRSDPELADIAAELEGFAGG
jgi:hypothetical protein